MGNTDAGDVTESVSGAPFLGVEAKEWEKLVAKGRESGEVHAEDVTHVLRHVELTGDVLVDVQSKMAQHGIAIDDAVEGHADHLDDVVEAPLADDADEKLLSRRRGRRTKKSSPRGEGGTSDAVRMYLRNRSGRSTHDRR